MGVKLTEQEIEEFLGQGHTLIVATTRRSGEPFMTPNWYVWLHGAFWVRTGARSAKVQHIRRDPRVCCMIEEGDAWVDLKAVIANCDTEIIDDEARNAPAQAALAEKYAAHRTQNTVMPDATRKHYGSDRVFLRMTPREGEIRSWYNRKIRMKTAG
jgi:PPOX class probable F420-dependent enzyme